MYAPASSGVYGVSNAHEWIYIGESDNIQDALLGHLHDADASFMKKGPSGFVFEICGRAVRTGRQNRLVLEYGPAFNRNSSRDS
jgi:hypothetical protein